MLYSPVIELGDDAVDVVGDVHAEMYEMYALIEHLGYDKKFNHPQGRKLVFVGDLIDRGPHSVQVALEVLQAVRDKRCYAVAGNHEVNILLDDPKPGACWFFDDESIQHDMFLPRQKASQGQKKLIIELMQSLPLVIKTPSFTIVHAQYEKECVERALGMVAQNQFTTLTQLASFSQGVIYDESIEKYGFNQKEFKSIKKKLYNPEYKIDPDVAQRFARCEMETQNNDPVRLLTSGAEEVLDLRGIFYAGRTRFAQRSSWWRSVNYQNVIFGHYWRLPSPPKAPGHYDPWSEQEYGWGFLGPGECFCVDYSSGRNYLKRTAGAKLNVMCAFRADERMAYTSDGQVIDVQKCTSIPQRTNTM